MFISLLAVDGVRHPNLWTSSLQVVPERTAVMTSKSVTLGSSVRAHMQCCAPLRRRVACITPLPRARPPHNGPPPRDAARPHPVRDPARWRPRTDVRPEIQEPDCARGAARRTACLLFAAGRGRPNRRCCWVAVPLRVRKYGVSTALSVSSSNGTPAQRTGEHEMAQPGDTSDDA